MKRLIFVLGLSTILWGQDTQPDRVTVPFRDASKERTLVVSVINGGMTIRGYDGKDAIIEANSGRGSNRGRIRPVPVPPGMHRLDNQSAGLDISENNNVVTINGGIAHSVELLIQVPVQTSLKLKTFNGGNLVVENITGEIEAENMNGAITITNVSGSVIANSMNGKVTVSLDKVTPDKSMSFSTMNGTIDVTLPADVKAKLKMKTDNGEIYVDDGFDVKLDASSRPPAVDDRRKSGGRYRVHWDRGTYGEINGGGPEIQFTSYNGSIMIHKK